MFARYAKVLVMQARKILAHCPWHDTVGVLCLVNRLTCSTVCMHLGQVSTFV